jgi:integrase/recombinase XerD
MRFKKGNDGCRKAPIFSQISLATKLGILLQKPIRKVDREDAAHNSGWIGMSLYSSTGERKYLNLAERQRFLGATRKSAFRIRLFCLMLLHCGGRISEILALTPAAIDLESGTVVLQTLKRRTDHIVRQVPVPYSVLRDLDREFGIRAMQRDPRLAGKRLWSWSRTSGWRYVKAVMAEASVHGSAAMPKGLRHTFGVAAFQARVPPHLVQRWLGHASLRTTAIYGDVIGREERAFAVRMWRNLKSSNRT